MKESWCQKTDFNLKCKKGWKKRLKNVDIIVSAPSLIFSVFIYLRGLQLLILEEPSDSVSYCVKPFKNCSLSLFFPPFIEKCSFQYLQ